MPIGTRAHKPAARAIERLHDAKLDAASGLHIGTVQIGDQRLRVGIRPGRGVPLLFCNGIWCVQSRLAIEKLIKMGYPREKLLWYRGGLQDWLALGFTTVVPQ